MFKISVGQTPHRKIMELRVKKASVLLLKRATQMEVTVACGFTNQAHFSRTFSQYYGITPGQFIRARL